MNRLYIWFERANAEKEKIDLTAQERRKHKENKRHLKDKTKRKRKRAKKNAIRVFSQSGLLSLLMRVLSDMKHVHGLRVRIAVFTEREK